jgi:tricorn protease
MARSGKTIFAAERYTCRMMRQNPYLWSMVWGATIVSWLVPFASPDTVYRPLLREPSISGTLIVFLSAGDLWTVPRTGGAAKRLTASPGLKEFPRFSPDGRHIAFTANYDGNANVYVMPTDGGDTKRLTYSPRSEEVVGWTPDGGAIVFRSTRTSFVPQFEKLFTVLLSGGLAMEVLPSEAYWGAFSPDGAVLAYNRIDRDVFPWKQYRGGKQAYISLFDLTQNRYSEVPHAGEADLYPMWRHNTIYFASDRTGTMNLFSYDLSAKTTRQLTWYTDFDVKWPSLGPDAIVYEHTGDLSVLNLATSRISQVAIKVDGDSPGSRPRTQKVEAEIRAFSPSPCGTLALFEARGHIFTASVDGDGSNRDLTGTAGVRERNPSWSPDGKMIAYLSDVSGEYEIYIRPSDGAGGPVQVTYDHPVFLAGPRWSPDSKALLYTDAALEMRVVTLLDRKQILVDTSSIDPISLGAWSPDSKWIIYTKEGINRSANRRQGVLYLYSTDERRAFRIGDGRYNDRQPVFDRNGRYVYFISDRTFAESMTWPETNVNFQNTSNFFALALRADLATLDVGQNAPLNSESTENSGPFRIDLEGLYGRLIPLPIPAARFDRLTAGTGRFFYTSQSSLHSFDMQSGRDSIMLTDVEAVEFCPSATKFIYRSHGSWGVADTAALSLEGARNFSVHLELHVDPQAEWAEIFKDSWRIMRDYYAEPGMKGLNWRAIGERYSQLAARVASRDDLTYIQNELIGELRTSHAAVNGVNTSGIPQTSIGLLGVDFGERLGHCYFKKIYAGENWNPNRRSPLTEFGVNVVAGDYLLAVNGTRLRSDMDPYSLFTGTADRSTELLVNREPTEDGARRVAVRPIPDETGVRYLDWIESNRRRVDAETDGKVAYVIIPDTSNFGINEFSKGFYLQTDKYGLIIDERFNSGGLPPDFLVEKLSRQLLYFSQFRQGASFQWPGEAIYGPKVMLVNEWAGSGGDSLPYLFRKRRLGPIIGRRTWGGLVGGTGPYTLLDGGSITVPQNAIWDPETGHWIAENHGIDPDVEVINTPNDVKTGRDSQLERAIAYIKAELRKHPQPRYKRPAYPAEQPRYPQR